MDESEITRSAPGAHEGRSRALTPSAAAWAARERAAVREDRARIARDLHDTVVQQLFAAGLELRAVAATLPEGGQVDGVLHVLGLVDLAIGQIRTAVLALSSDAEAGESLRQRVLAVVRDLRRPFRFAPSLVFEGPVDLVVRDALADDVVAVVRESLANAARHAAAEHVAVTVAAMGGIVRVEVRDDGVGLPAHPRHRGLLNLAARARERGGGFTISTASPGTLVVWRVPFPEDGSTP